MYCPLYDFGLFPPGYVKPNKLFPVVEGLRQFIQAPPLLWASGLTTTSSVNTPAVPSALPLIFMPFSFHVAVSVPFVGSASYLNPPPSFATQPSEPNNCCPISPVPPNSFDISASSPLLCNKSDITASSPFTSLNQIGLLAKQA